MNILSQELVQPHLEDTVLVSKKVLLTLEMMVWHIEFMVVVLKLWVMVIIKAEINIMLVVRKP